MKKENIPAAEIHKSAYAKPLVKMVKVDAAGIICSSDETASFKFGCEAFEEEDW